MQSVIESAGHEPHPFACGADLLQSTVLDAAHCVIVDVRMPGMGGLELQRRIKLQRPLLPILFISAHADDGVRREAIEGGAAGFMYKPFDGAELLGAIERALDESDQGHGTE